MRPSRAVQTLLPFLMCLLFAVVSCTRKETVNTPAPEKALVKLAWDNVITVSKTTPTLQVVVMLRRSSEMTRVCSPD